MRVPADLAGERLDRAVAALGGRTLGREVSRRQARRWIEAGQVFVEGRPVRIASRTVAAGARLEIVPSVESGPGPPALEPERILFEDPHLLAVDKPAGVAVQAHRQSTVDHLQAMAEHHLAERLGHTVRLELVHRLDRGTSGVVLFAKDTETAGRLGRAFQEREVTKTYQAVVAVVDPWPPDAWTVQDVLAMERLGNGRRRAVRVDTGPPSTPDGNGRPTLDGNGRPKPDGDGRPAYTEFRLHQRLHRSAWVEARPITGRTHQIRVHLATDGWPILGDRLYGPRYGPGEAPSGYPQRPLLHASRLALEHPHTGRPIVVESPIPPDFEAWVDQHPSMV